MVQEERRRESRYLQNPPRKEATTKHIKSDSCNGKRTGSAEPETPRKSLRIYSWAENQEECGSGGVIGKVWLTESTCCLDNLNIQYKRKEVENMENARVSCPQSGRKMAAGWRAATEMTQNVLDLTAGPQYTQVVTPKREPWSDSNNPKCHGALRCLQRRLMCRECGDMQQDFEAAPQTTLQELWCPWQPSSSVRDSEGGWQKTATESF